MVLMQSSISRADCLSAVQAVIDTSNTDATSSFKYGIDLTNYDIVSLQIEGYHTIVYLPLQGTVTGTAVVSNINFADEVGTSIYRYPENSTVEIDISTAINGISAEQTKSGTIYNMAGQRVSKANKGVYVVDGKKVAVSK